MKKNASDKAINKGKVNVIDKGYKPKPITYQPTPPDSNTGTTQTTNTSKKE